MGADTSWSMGIHRILISDLRGRCIIGVNEEECRNKQDVIIIWLSLPIFAKRTTATDSKMRLIYRALKKRIVAKVEGSHYYLVEAFAEAELPQGRRWAGHAAFETGNPLCL